MENFHPILFLSLLCLHYLNCQSTNSLNMSISNPIALPSNLSFVTFSPTYIYTLAPNHLIQLLNKNNPSQVQFNITTFVSGPNQPDNISIFSMVFNKSYQGLAIVAQNNTKLIYFLYSIINNTIIVPTFSVSFTTFNLSSPSKTFMDNQKICSFYNNQSPSKDLIYCFSLNNYNTFTVNLTTNLASLSISPNIETAIIWDNSSRIFVYSIKPNIQQLHYYNGSYTPQRQATQSISFSSDSKLALIQSDTFNPIRIMDLSDFSIIQNITIQDAILSVDFMDINNQYILINCPAITYIYNRATSQFFTIYNTLLTADSILVDYNTSHVLTSINAERNWTQLFIFQNSIQNSTNLTNNNNTANSSNSSNSNNSSNNVTNITILPTVTSPLRTYQLNLSEWQNTTFEQIGSASSVLLNVMNKINLILFSSPFTCFFLGFLNYFTLNSLYVLLNIPLPSVLFDQLSNLYQSVNLNLLNFLNINLTVGPFTEELVDDQQALYFGLTSDILSSNYYTFGLILVNIFIFQILLAINTTIPKDSPIHQFLEFQREQIYFGLAVSLMVGLFLPWRFIKNGQVQSFNGKINAIAQHLLCYFLVSILLVKLISIYSKNYTNSNMSIKKKLKQKQKKGRSKQKKKLKIVKQMKSPKKIRNSVSLMEDLPECIIGFQNLIYPLFVTAQHPIYFLTLVFFSKIFEIQIFLKHSKEKGISRYLQIGSFICQLFYHLTFFIFLYIQNEQVIIYNCMVCLGIFYLGAIFNIMLILIFFAMLLKKIFVSARGNNKINDVGKEKQLKDLKKEQPNLNLSSQQKNKSPIVIFQIIDDNLANDSNIRQNINLKHVKETNNIKFLYNKIKK